MTMINGPDLIVIRGTGTGHDGRWLDRNNIGWMATGDPCVAIFLVPVQEFEVRDDDGAVAQVWRPLKVTEKPKGFDDPSLGKPWGAE